MSTKEELRKEHNKRVADGTYREQLGCACVNCGSIQQIEYHHIVPLCMGGTNRLTNIAPVCKKCHVAIHGEAEYRKFAYQKACNRPKVKLEDYEDILWQYADCKIDLGSTKSILGLSPKTGLTGKKIYKQFLKKHGMIRIINNVGRLMKDCDWPPSKGKIVGYIIYEGGITKEIRYEG